MFDRWISNYWNLDEKQTERVTSYVKNKSQWNGEVSNMLVEGEDETPRELDFSGLIAMALGEKREQPVNLGKTKEAVENNAGIKAKNSIEGNKTNRIQARVPRGADGLRKRLKGKGISLKEDKINRIQTGVPRELLEFREQWKEKSCLPEETKEKIIEAAEKIPLRIQKENKEDKNDGTMRIEFELNWKQYKFLDIDLGIHSDEKYLSHSNDTEGKLVSLKWMIWPMLKWDNEKLKMYVMEKMGDWFKERSTEEDMKPLLKELWKLAGLERGPEKMAMLEYLTGMEWWYRWGLIDENIRSQMLCSEYGCQFYSSDSFFAKLCLFSCSWV